jgi:hypothetical protein
MKEKGAPMNGQNPNKKSTHSHGLRVVKAASSETLATQESLANSAPGSSKLKVCVSEEKALSDAAAVARKKVLRNPLLMQLNALANALDDEVNQILKL